MNPTLSSVAQLGPAQGGTVDLVRLALDAASLRHQAISQNIANVHAPDFHPVRVGFEQQLGALRASLEQGRHVTPDMLRGVQPVLQRDPSPPGADRTAMLDLEVADLAQNTVQYEALLKALNKHLAILGTAISDGRR